ncbi:MAG: hypothetical protein H0X27_13645 [Caulobacteraceae bacterium]|nr:hypothetical protein [Caulobacteraceae bacterium]
MRKIGIGLALSLAALWAGLAPALAAPKPAVPEVSKESRAKGMAAVPAIIQAAGIDCQLADARQIGESVDPKTKAKTTFYEAACTGNEGVVIAAAAVGEAPQAFTCMETSAPAPDGKPNSLACVLPGNADPKAGLLPYIVKSGRPCTPDKVRPLGHSPTNTLFELACHEGAGYILSTSAPPRLDKAVTMNPCILYDPAGTVKCELTDRATQLAVVDTLVKASGKPCAIKDRAFVGAAKSGANYFEVSCQEGKGFVLEQAPNGALTRAIDCAQADFLNGGCKLTDARQAKTEQAGLYTQLAQKAGFPCTVSGYAPFGVNLPGKEVVELACSNRSDGGIGIFAAGSGSSMVYDCAHSELKSFRCSLTKPAAAYPKLTADLKAVGKATCVVSNARTVGVTADQKGYIEVACADGLQGYFIEFEIEKMTPKTAIVCSEAKGIAGGCTLPGNAKKG